MRPERGRQSSPKTWLNQVAHRLQVWLATREVVRTLHRANGLAVRPEVKEELRRLLTQAYVRRKDAATPGRRYLSYIAEFEKALVGALPRAPLWGGLHPPVDPIELTLDEFRAGLKSICPLWPIC
jgi:hypothetical protein